MAWGNQTVSQSVRMASPMVLMHQHDPFGRHYHSTWMGSARTRTRVTSEASLAYPRSEATYMGVGDLRFVQKSTIDDHANGWLRRRCGCVIHAPFLRLCQCVRTNGTRDKYVGRCQYTRTQPSRSISNRATNNSSHEPDVQPVG